MNINLLLTMSGVIALSYWLEEHTKWVAHISAILLIVIIASVLGNSGIVPSADIDYYVHFKWLMPLGIILLLLAFNPSHILKIKKDFLICFMIGAIATGIGGVVAGLIFHNLLPLDYWRISGQFTASFIGGSENAVAVGTALQTPMDVFLKAFAGDNVITAVWIIINIFLCRESALDNSDNTLNANPNISTDHFSTSFDVASLAITMTIAIAVLEFSTYVHNYFASIPRIMIASMIATLMTFTPLRQRFTGSYIFGTLFLSYFIFGCGALCNVSHLFNNSAISLVFPATIILIHAVILFGTAKILKIKREIVIITSQCLIGGPGTALAVVAASKLNYHFEAVALGLLGYAIGNYFGFGVAWFLKLYG